MPPKTQLIVENSFIESNHNSNELGITVYNRVFSKLVNEKQSLGKVCPIYLKVGKVYKVLGIFTLNKSGSYSFFPEFTDSLQFDHITFVKDVTGGHHYTGVTPEGRQKVLPIFAEHLTNGVYSVASFMISDIGLLKNAPREVIYPLVDTERLQQIKDAFFTAGKQEGSTIFELKDTEGTVCIQLFLIPSSVDYKSMMIYTGPYKKFQTDFNIENGVELNLSNLVIPHEYQNDYMLGAVAFVYPGKTDHPIVITTASNKAGFYSKLDITYRK
jgi:hypothetical protein